MGTSYTDGFGMAGFGMKYEHGTNRSANHVSGTTASIGHGIPLWCEGKG